MKNEFNKTAKTETKQNDFIAGYSNFLNSVDNSEGGNEAERYGPYSLMLKRRIIMVQGQVETNMAAHIIQQLKYLEEIDGSEPITMVVNSPGGSVVDGLAIVDIMREVKCPIRTVGVGMQASMGSIILAAGDERVMSKRSQLLIHQIMGGASGGTQHSDFEISAAFMAKEHEELKSVYVEFTGLNHKFWDIVGERDTWFTAEQAKEMGFITHISANEKAGGPYESEAKRANKTRLGTGIDDAKTDFLKTASTSELLEIINNGSAEGGIYSRMRAEILVALSKKPEFWVESRQKAYAAAKVANDDVKAVVPKQLKINQHDKKGPQA